MAGPAPIKPARVQPVPPPMNSPEGRAAAEERAAAANSARRELPKWRRFFRKAVPWLFLILLGCVVMQIALAGAGLLGDEAYWTTGTSEFLDAHIFFVHILELFPVLILLAGFLGADKEAGWSGVGLLVLTELQYMFIALDGVARSFHVLNALVIFTLTLLMTLSRIPWRPKFIDAAPAAKGKA
jgi:hypothetical protein